MAKFKLYLMSLRGSESEFSPRYSLMPISEFNTQYNEYDGWTRFKKDKNQTIYEDNRGKKAINGWSHTEIATANFIQDQSFTYTSNEKFQIHQNSQRTLTFTMYRNVIRADRIEINPFINYLFVGAQLLLVDKYDKHHLMTVSKISYQFNELNTEFSYECQDSFSYQLSRQNAGYEIENNTDGDINDFIGAQSLDWWVLCKIHPDCKISYQYLKLDDSRDFKQAYVGDQYRDYHRTVPFSGSGTANSILIALGELYGLQLQVYERVDLRPTMLQDSEELNNPDYGKCEKYYWFAPTKSLRPTGLKYSPYGDLQSFTLEHTGNSFASVLNVQSNTIGEEIITMFPSIPNFFRQWFETEEWRNSYFYSGLFSSVCQEHVDYISFDGISVEIDNSKLTDEEVKINNYLSNKIYYTDNLVYIPIKPAKWYTKYDFIQFSTNGGAYSKLNITSGKDSITYNSKYNNWKMVYKLKKSANATSNTTEETVWSNESTIPYDLINKNGLDYFYLVLKTRSGASLITVMGGLYISQYRIPTSEELEFAEIADQIPWLENKLISFDYFYEHSIINAIEHAELMHLLENNLRKTNAKLLLYSQLYYQSIQNRTTILANLSAKLDMVGATFQSDILNPYFEDGRITKTTDFTLAISDLFANTTEPISLLGYYETLSDYVNKYFNAEQTFLKNMHLFRDYFNSKANLGILYKYTFTLPNQDNKDIQISFTTPNQYVTLNEKNQHYPIYEKVDGVYQIYNKDNIVTSDTIGRFHYLDPEADNMKEIKNNTPEYHTFNDKQQYFELAWKVKIISGWPTQKNNDLIPLIVVSGPDDDIEKFELELLSLQDNTHALLSCYMHCLHHETELTKGSQYDFKYDENTTITIQIINNYYKPVDYTALRNNFFYQQFKNSNRTKLKYMHRRKSGGNEMLCQVQIADDSSASWANRFSDLNIDSQIFLSFPNSKNWNSNRIDKLKNGDNNIADDVYKESFPITTMYWKGKQNNDTTLQDEYHDVPFVNIENCQQFHRRVSVSCEERTKWGNAGWFGVPLLIAWIAYWVWNDGLKAFGNSGWTYHDIFNCNYAPAFGDDGWTKSTRFMYVTNSEGYEKTNKRNIFSTSCFSGEEGWKGNCDKTYQDLESEINDTATVSKWGYYEAKYIPLTYHSFMRRLDDHWEKYHYKTKYWRILKNTDIVNNLEGIEVIVKYVKINTDNNMALLKTPISLKIQGDDADTSVTIDRLNSTVYYPLKHAIVAQNLSEFTWPENVSEMPLEELLENNQLTGTWNTQGNIWTGTIEVKENGESKSVKGNLIFIKTEDFNYEDITDLHWETIDNGTINYDNLWEYSSSPYYDNKTHQQVNLITEYPDITVGFYVTGNEDEDYIPATSVDDKKIYYEHLGNKYEPRYTMNQLINNHNMYVKRQDIYEYMTFNQIETLNTTYFAYNTTQKTVQEEIGTIQLNTEKNKWILTGQSIDTPIELTCPVPESTNYNDCTNGWFWYKNRNAIASPLLMEKAMLIETNLTEYWTNAYYASKNCKFFLPEYWQPTVNQKTNYFSNNILLVTKEKNATSKLYEDVDIKLSSTYIPQVIKIPNQPRYQLRHAGILDSLQTTRAIQYGLNVGDSVVVSSIVETPIQQMVDYLKLNSSEWMAVKLSYGDNVLYQYQDGGMLWTDALNKLTNTALQYDQFGGWYDMMVRVLQSCNYQNYDPIQYRQAQEEHDAIWRQIYIKYPNLIYEQSYTNEDVTSSKELLTMAQWAFKDYTQPESNYNISVIDSNTLKGYKGQELSIGDGIEVNATELYDDAGSDIYKSLVQYLYITDINYDLRQDDNIQLTVNSIKYRDKVIGELVKLIR